MTHTVSAAVRTIREARGYSQGELARRAGLAKATVNDLESNAGRSPGLDTLTQIADALDVHVATLIGVETATVASGAISELTSAGAAMALGALGLQVSPAGDAPTRFFFVKHGFSLHAIHFHAGDVLTVKATGEPAIAGAVMVQNRGSNPGFEARLYLDPYLIGPDCEGILRHDMKQSPELSIIGEIQARTGNLA